MSRGTIDTFAFILDCKMNRYTAYPEASGWPISQATLDGLTKMIASSQLQELGREAPASVRPRTTAQAAFKTLSETHSIKYFSLPALGRVGMSFFALFFTVDANVVIEYNERHPSHVSSYAVVVAFTDVSRVFCWNLLPTLRDWMEKAYSEILWKYVLGSDVTDAIQRASNLPNPVPPHWTFTNFIDEWEKKIVILRENIKLWYGSYVNVEQIDVEQTLFAQDFSTALAKLSQPNLVPSSALRQSLRADGSTTRTPAPTPRESNEILTSSWHHLHQVIVSVLTHHCAILRGSNRETINTWLRTVGMFLPEDKFLLMRDTCNPDEQIIPDLHFQGTTATKQQIMLYLHLFRYPPLVIDVDQPLEKPAHLFPKDTLILFEEKRLRVFCPGINEAPSGSTGIVTQNFMDNCVASALTYVARCAEAASHNGVFRVFVFDRFYLLQLP